MIFSFPTSNNPADYKVSIARLTFAKEVGETHVRLYMDSQLVVS